jgi:hypothetical protein
VESDEKDQRSSASDPRACARADIPGLIGNPAEEATAAQIIQSHFQMIDRAHALGLKVHGGTLNPVEGYPFPITYIDFIELRWPRQAMRPVLLDHVPPSNTM